MKLKIISIENKGVLDKEVVWLDVLEDCQLDSYLVSDTTYRDASHISNELRHIYWFHSTSARKGDYVALYTRNGLNVTVSNNRGASTHMFFWNLGKTVWNKDGDCAVLFEVATWKITRA